jgi:predicted transcriptional regulator
MKDNTKFTLYIPPENNEKVEFLRYKTKQSKNIIILKALDDYLVKEIKKYPDYKP